jgi:hypothetical protein
MTYSVSTTSENIQRRPIMEVNMSLANVSPGMQVQSSDGKVLGTITGMDSHGAETYLEVTPARSLAVWLHLIHYAPCMYLPGSAVTAVSRTHVMLGIDASMARGFKLRPNWFAGSKTANLQFW